MFVNYRPIVVLAAVGAAFALGACGGSGGGVAATVNNTTAATPGSVGAAGPAQAAQAPSTAPTGAPSTSVPEGPRVERSARLVLDVNAGKFPATLDSVIALVDQAGGYVSGTEAQAAAGQQPHSGQATFQVPADKLDSVVAAIRAKGTPESITISGNDVSQQYVDLQARLRNEEAQRAAMLALMQQAKTVADTISIENQLAQVQGQIEQLQGQINYLDHTTTYATLSVTIQELPAGPADQWGLQTALGQAAHNVVTVVAFLVLVLGSLSPALVLALVLTLAGRRLWPRMRRAAQE